MNRVGMTSARSAYHQAAKGVAEVQLRLDRAETPRDRKSARRELGVLQAIKAQAGTIMDFGRLVDTRFKK